MIVVSPKNYRVQENLHGSARAIAPAWWGNMPPGQRWCCGKLTSCAFHTGISLSWVAVHPTIEAWCIDVRKHALMEQGAHLQYLQGEYTFWTWRHALQNFRSLAAWLIISIVLTDLSAFLRTFVCKGRVYAAWICTDVRWLLGMLFFKGIYNFIAQALEVLPSLTYIHLRFLLPMSTVIVLLAVFKQYPYFPLSCRSVRLWCCVFLPPQQHRKRETCDQCN